MKYYSEVTKEMYNSEKELVAAERKKAIEDAFKVKVDNVISKVATSESVKVKTLTFNIWTTVEQRRSINGINQATLDGFL